MTVYTVPWEPQPKQAELLRASGLYDVMYGGAPGTPVARMIGYGGAAYGGKSDGLLGLAGVAAFAFPGCKIGYFRRTYTELEGADGAIERSLELFSGVAEYHQGAHRWTFPTASRLYFCHCQYEKDIYNYQSQAWDILLIDEATHFPWSMIDYLITRNRPTGEYQDTMLPFTCMATNPGNIGHAWYSQAFDVLETIGVHNEVKRVMTPNGSYEQTFFIPAFAEDNPIGLERDPEYLERLEKRDPAIARALRYGDWTVFAGQAIPEWSRLIHMVDPFIIPDSWPRWRALDYGYVHPFVAGWFTRNVDNGRIFIYRDLEEAGLTDRQQARQIQTLTPADERILFTYASPDAWTRKTKDDLVYTAVDEYLAEGVYLTRADNDRLQGIRKIHRLLAPLEDGRPGLQVFNTVQSVPRCIPLMIRSKVNPEDAEKIDGDDPYDMVRYGLTNYKLAAVAAEKRAKERVSPMTQIGVF